MSDNIPTLPLPRAKTPPPPPQPPSVPAPPRETPPSRAPMVAFIVVAALVVATLVVLVFALLGRNSAQGPTVIGTSTASTSAVAPSPTVHQLPGSFTTFAAPPVQPCDRHGKGRQPIKARVSWATANSTQVWIAPGTADAVSAMGQPVPLTGNQDAVPNPLLLDCSNKSMTFTLTLVGDDGAHVSRTWTVDVASRP